MILMEICSVRSFLHKKEACMRQYNEESDFTYPIHSCDAVLMAISKGKHDSNGYKRRAALS